MFEQHGPGKFRDATHVAKQSSNCVSDKKRCTEKTFIKKRGELKREGCRKAEIGIFTPVIKLNILHKIHFFAYPATSCLFAFRVPRMYMQRACTRREGWKEATWE